MVADGGTTSIIAGAECTANVAAAMYGDNMEKLIVGASGIVPLYGGSGMCCCTLIAILYIWQLCLQDFLPFFGLNLPFGNYR
jgi:hypothetical protein